MQGLTLKTYLCNTYDNYLKQYSLIFNGPLIRFFPPIMIKTSEKCVPEIYYANPVN